MKCDKGWTLLVKRTDVLRLKLAAGLAMADLRVVRFDN